MAQIQIKVIIDEAHVGQTEALCRSLTSLGMKVESAMPEIGVIFGSAEESLLPKVSATEGVEQATPEGRLYASPAKRGT